MKFFWWTAPDPHGIISQSLHSIDLEDDQGWQQHYNVTAETLLELIQEGHVEVSHRTAYAMGWPA